MSEAGHCRDCGATVFWFKTVAGGKVPLDPLPLRIAVLIPGQDGEAATVSVRPARSIHFDTCSGKKPASRRRR